VERENQRGTCPGSVTVHINEVQFEEIGYSNMLTLNALVELLADKGLLRQAAILER
jgi:hypothetical protein